LINKALTSCLDTEILSNPKHMIELAKLISDRKETTFVPTIGDKVRQRIKELIKTSVEREEKNENT